MSEYQDTIDALKRLAYADEGDTITCADLWKCDMAVAVIEDLESENELLREAAREAYEVYAGSDGFIPKTAPEAYQQRLLTQMAAILGSVLKESK